MRRIVTHSVLLALLILTQGCTTSPSSPTEREANQQLVGRDIHEVISRIGVPDSEREIAGYTAYTWRTTQIVEHKNFAPDYQSYTTQAVDASCVLKLTMEDEIVLRAYWDGHYNVCAYYRDRLGPRPI
jgi:hypothetical protein